jgi:hypothetical protein
MPDLARREEVWEVSVTRMMVTQELASSNTTKSLDQTWYREEFSSRGSRIWFLLSGHEGAGQFQPPERGTV